jgi:hypothetical protein
MSGIGDDQEVRLARIEDLLLKLRMEADACREEMQVAADGLADRSPRAKQSSAAAKSRAERRRQQTARRTRRKAR